MFLSFWLFRLQLWAQDFDDDDITVFSGGGRGATGMMDDMSDMIDYRPMHIRPSDIVMLVVLLVACYVFGKIWKGCTYLILAFAALMYYITRF